ncbi:hypothetical protein HYC85_020382 [Camellia sinensis]|uniref:Generative cell specific-1/HAP2 domain-containing protein n=1 Tax=Camellia sinensis TaxID=4442 RepID=A0A7J7GPV6_CAMSI|nr:hypothetical protein HYC85_020382 [Camellia sinensis]
MLICQCEYSHCQRAGPGPARGRVSGRPRNDTISVIHLGDFDFDFDFDFEVLYVSLHRHHRLHRFDFSDFDFDFEAPPPPPPPPPPSAPARLRDENGHVIEHTEPTCCPCGNQPRVPSSCGNFFDKMMKGKANTAHCLRFPGDWFHVFGIGQHSVGFSIRIEVKTASKISNNANKPTASHGTATPESNNVPIGQPSSGSAFIKPKGYSASKDIQFTESSVLVRGKTPTAAMTKADMGQLVQNKGNAMQRYKEEKKY